MIKLKGLLKKSLPRKLLFEARNKDHAIYIMPCLECEYIKKCNDYHQLYQIMVINFKQIYDMKKDLNICLALEHVCSDFKPKKEPPKKQPEPPKPKKQKEKKKPAPRVLIIKGGKKKLKKIHGGQKK